MAGDDVVDAPRIKDDGRWPNYLPTALSHGLKAQLGVRLHLGDYGTIGGLNLYSTTSEDITDEDVTLAAFFATHATVALGRARHIDSLNGAVATRQLVGQAIGILMERYDIGEKSAHAFLWRASMNSNLKVRSIARTLVNEVNNRPRA